MGCPTIVTGSPGLKVVFVQPCFAMMLTAPPSISQVPAVSLPALSGTLTMMWVCGFSQLYSTTVPWKVTFFDISNIANEWCPYAAVTANRRPHNARVLAAFTLYFPHNLIVGEPP